MWHKHNENSRKKRGQGTGKKKETRITENFPQINVEDQTKDPGNSENTK